jgi:hypothetical protein
MNKVWTYIISRDLTETELNDLRIQGQNFVKSWTAHEMQLQASFEIFKNKIIIVKVNEDVTGASGCSIDKLARFIKDSEANFHIELLNRLLVAIKTDKGIEVVHSSKIKELLGTGIISENTIVYNTASAKENELNNWEQPLKNTWLSKYLVRV